jgi:branched-chain amino acid aminotransferase
VRCFLNGELLDQQQARVPISDRGFLYGDGLFETLRVLDCRAAFLHPHLDRLELGMQLLGFEAPPLRDTIESACAQVLSVNDIGAGVLRIAVTRGSGSRGANPYGCGPATLLVTLAPLPADLAERMQRGYRLVISDCHKPGPRALPNQAKLANYLNSILAMRQAVQRGADEAILLDDAGYLVECSQSNLFFVRQGMLLTADLGSGALHGITRATILELARQLGVPCHEQALPRALIAQAQEAFITNSVIGVVPVAAIEAQHYGHDAQVTGEITALLQASWWTALRASVRS